MLLSVDILSVDVLWIYMLWICQWIYWTQLANVCSTRKTLDKEYLLADVSAEPFLSQKNNQPSSSWLRLPPFPYWWKQRTVWNLSEVWVVTLLQSHIFASKDKGGKHFWTFFSLNTIRAKCWFCKFLFVPLLAWFLPCHFEVQMAHTSKKWVCRAPINRKLFWISAKI